MISQRELELYSKFPAILKLKLIDGEIVFPADTQYTYENILAYRCIEREEEDNSKVCRDDFKSYAEKKVKKTRGNKINQTQAEYYGTSLFTDPRIVENKMKLPNPRKKMASGEVYFRGGPSLVNEKSKHVCWWLYELVNLDGFSICEGGKSGE